MPIPKLIAPDDKWRELVRECVRLSSHVIVTIDMMSESLRYELRQIRELQAERKTFLVLGQGAKSKLRWRICRLCRGGHFAGCEDWIDFGFAGDDPKGTPWLRRPYACLVPYLEEIIRRDASRAIRRWLDVGKTA